MILRGICKEFSRGFFRDHLEGLMRHPEGVSFMGLVLTV
jgi:hypothetical protein